MFMEKFVMIKICVFRVKYFFCFILFVIFCSYFSEGFDSHVILFCHFSISGIAPLITCYNLQFKNIFKKFITSFMYFSYSAFQRLLQICVFFNFLLNVEGIKSSKRKLKLMQYFKDKTGSTGVLFLQETDFDSKVEQK